MGREHHAGVCRSISGETLMYSRNVPPPAVPEEVEARTAVRIQDQRPRSDWRSEILFLLLAVAPWIVLVWLLWPRR